MTVQFMLPVQKDVTVSVSTDQPWASVSPQTLTFTLANGETSQSVTVSVSADAASQCGK